MERYIDGRLSERFDENKWGTMIVAARIATAEAYYFFSFFFLSTSRRRISKRLCRNVHREPPSGARSARTKNRNKIRASVIRDIVSVAPSLTRIQRAVDKCSDNSSTFGKKKKKKKKDRIASDDRKFPGIRKLLGVLVASILIDCA